MIQAYLDNTANNCSMYEFLDTLFISSVPYENFENPVVAEIDIANDYTKNKKIYLERYVDVIVTGTFHLLFM